MKNDPISINTAQILTLRKNASDFNLSIHCVELVEWVNESTDTLYSYLKNDEIDNDRLISLIIENKTTLDTAIFSDYCKEIGGSYQSIALHYLLRNFEARIMNDNKQIVSGLLNYLHSKKEALIFTESLKRVKNNSENLMYSHRSHGWNYELYTISSKFRVSIISNFGYGYVSYFYTKLNFDGIDIIALSDWIEYKNANVNEIIKYTKKHILEDSEWIQSFEFIIEANRVYNTNLQEFIEKYIIKECEKLIEGIEDLYKNDVMCFREVLINETSKSNPRGSYEYIKAEIPYNERKYQLIRANKITGALSFIEQINKYKPFFDIKVIVERIEMINKKMYPIMISENTVIYRQIFEAKNMLITHENDLQKLRETFDKSLNNKAVSIGGDQIILQRDHVQDMDKLGIISFLIKYPNFGSQHAEYNELKKIVFTTSELIKELEYQSKQMNGFLQNFNDYFAVK